MTKSELKAKVEQSTFLSKGSYHLEIRQTNKICERFVILIWWTAKDWKSLEYVITYSKGSILHIKEISATAMSSYMLAELEKLEEREESK